MKGKPPRRQLSGHAKRQRAREKQLAALRAQAAALGMELVEAGAALPPADDDGAAEFAKLEAPPLGDPFVALGWVRKLQLVALRLATTAPLTDAVRERLRLAKDLSAVIGMTHARSSMEAEIKQLRDAIATVRTPGGAVRLERAESIAKPPTARGMRRNRPRPLVPVEPPQGPRPASGADVPGGNDDDSKEP